MSNATRRAVVRTGVWAVPAIATAAAAPAFAGTESQCVTLVSVVSACKKPCAKGSTQSYSVTLSFSACQNKSVTIVSWDMTGTAATYVSPSCFAVSMGTGTQAFTVTESGTPGATLTLSYMVDGVTYTTTVDLGDVGDCASSS